MYLSNIHGYALFINFLQNITIMRSHKQASNHYVSIRFDNFICTCCRSKRLHASVDESVNVEYAFVSDYIRQVLFHGPTSKSARNHREKAPAMSLPYENVRINGTETAFGKEAEVAARKSRPSKAQTEPPRSWGAPNDPADETLHAENLKTMNNCTTPYTNTTGTIQPASANISRPTTVERQLRLPDLVRSRPRDVADIPSAVETSVHHAAPKPSAAAAAVHSF